MNQKVINHFMKILYMKGLDILKPLEVEVNFMGYICNWD